MQSFTTEAMEKVSLVDFINSIEYPVYYLVDGPGGSGEQTAYFADAEGYLADQHFGLQGFVEDGTWSWDGLNEESAHGPNYLRLLTCTSNRQVWECQRAEYESQV